MPYYNTVISKMRCDMWSHSSFSDTQQSQMMEKHSWHTNEAIISLYNITKNDCSHSFILLSFSHCTLMQLLYKKTSSSFFLLFCVIFLWRGWQKHHPLKTICLQFVFLSHPKTHLCCCITALFIAGPFIWPHVLISSIKTRGEPVPERLSYLGRIKSSSCKSPLKCSKL